jgi:hypothetical protein
MKNNSYKCPFCNRTNSAALLAPICSFCGRNRRDPNAQFMIIIKLLKKSIWFKIFALLVSLAMVLRLCIWAFDIKSVAPILALLFIVAIGGYWYMKRQNIKR